MIGIVQIEELHALRSRVFWVSLVPDDGLAQHLAEFVWRCDAVRFATDYAARYGARLHSAEVIPFPKGAAA